MFGMRKRNQLWLYLALFTSCDVTSWNRSKEGLPVTSAREQYKYGVKHGFQKSNVNGGETSSMPGTCYSCNARIEKYNRTLPKLAPICFLACSSCIQKKPNHDLIGPRSFTFVFASGRHDECFSFSSDYTYDCRNFGRCWSWKMFRIPRN